jgi:putative ABC transport system permease protein
VGIRKTLGSSRSQLVSQFLFETSLIILLASGLALMLVIASLPLFNNWIQQKLTFHLEWLTMGFVSLMLGGIVVLAGGYPAAVLSASRPGQPYGVR